MKAYEIAPRIASRAAVLSLALAFVLALLPLPHARCAGGRPLQLSHELFPGVPHGWLNDTMPGRYRAKAADEAWLVLLKFLADVFCGAWPGTGQVRWEFESAISLDYDFSKNVRLE